MSEEKRREERESARAFQSTSPESFLSHTDPEQHVASTPVLKLTLLAKLNLPRQVRRKQKPFRILG